MISPLDSSLARGRHPSSDLFNDPPLPSLAPPVVMFLTFTLPPSLLLHAALRDVSGFGTLDEEFPRTDAHRAGGGRNKWARFLRSSKPPSLPPDGLKRKPSRFGNNVDR